MSESPPAGPAKTPRTILYTGKGGVGKTSVAAATARACAAEGLRTVVLSTDPAHSLSDSLEQRLGSTPTPLDDTGLLWGQEVQAQAEMERNWSAVRDWLSKLLADRGVAGIAAEELSVPPGMDELFSLLQIKRHHDSGEFDVIVVDCAPTGETLRLLSFPEVARWWLDKILPWERRLVGAARPIARSFLDVPLPGEDVFSDVQSLVENLIDMHSILSDHGNTSIRLVMNADRMVIKEAQRTFTYLNLYGYLTDAVVVNRLFPDELEDGYFGPWRERQAESMTTVREGFDPVPVLTARYFDTEVIGPRMLDRLAAEVFEDRGSPAAVMHDEIGQRIRSDGDVTVLEIRVPFADRSELSLKRIGTELVVAAAGERRTIVLPAALQDRRPSGAKLEGGRLEIRFEGRGAVAPASDPPPRSEPGEETPSGDPEDSTVDHVG